LSLRASEPTPSVPDTFGPQTKRNLIPFVAAGVVLALVVTVAAFAATGRLQLPFVGKPTFSEVDPVFHWSITFPRAWAAKKGPAKDTVRYVSQGDGVGIRVEAEFLKGEVSAAEARSNDMTTELKQLEGPNQSRPDASIVGGPTFGTTNGVPYVQFLVTYTDFSTGVAVPIEDSDNYLFNGANLEIVRFETDAKNFSAQSSAFAKALQSFHSKNLTEGTPVATPTSVTATATATATATP
jgi:hypothetical protein